MAAASFWKSITRRKVIQQPEESRLGRVLTTLDLTCLGVGATLGVGLYVLVGKVAKETAGPSIVLSFFIAAVASCLAGLCYAEFGARVPRAGSAYIYSYVCVGELVAFIIGWNLILEYIIGSASVAHGMSLYIDAMCNESMKTAFLKTAPINLPYLSAYFDFFAFGISLLLAVLLAFGVKESSMLNNCITSLNLFIVVFVVICGATRAKWSNWTLQTDEVPSQMFGTGGFFPYGISGMIRGAATCFYGFIGFDCIATTGEEAQNPRRSIPLAILISLGISFLAYVATATIVTMMVPYYAQNIDAPVPFAFEYFGMKTAKWVVNLGGVLALCASLYGAMFPLPRIIYAMANDALIFRVLGVVNERFATPIWGTLLSGFCTGLLAATFDQSQLVDMMSIGTLLAYTIVAACILILRYSVDQPVNTDSRGTSFRKDKRAWMDFLFNNSKLIAPNERTEQLATLEVFAYCILCIALGLDVMFLGEQMLEDVGHLIIPLALATAMLILLISLASQPKSKKHLQFKVPLIPVVPAISILINIYLMISLGLSTWMRFGVWMSIGFGIYAFYGFPNNFRTHSNYEQLE